MGHLIKIFGIRCRPPKMWFGNAGLFDIATAGSGFATDEPMETLGEKLALPPFLEPRRVEIEAGLKPIG